MPAKHPKKKNHKDQCQMLLPKNSIVPNRAIAAAPQRERAPYTPLKSLRLVAESRRVTDRAATAPQANKVVVTPMPTAMARPWPSPMTTSSIPFARQMP